MIALLNKFRKRLKQRLKSTLKVLSVVFVKVLLLSRVKLLKAIMHSFVKVSVRHDIIENVLVLFSR